MHVTMPIILLELFWISRGFGTQLGSIWTVFLTTNVTLVKVIFGPQKNTIPGEQLKLFEDLFLQNINIIAGMLLGVFCKAFLRCWLSF